MTFGQLPYHRPDIQVLKGSFTALLSDFEKSQNAKQKIEIVDQINNLRNDFDTQYNIAHIRHTIDTTNEFYEKENDYFDNQMPEFQNLINQYYRVLSNTADRKELIAHFGTQLFDIAEMSVKTIRTDVIEDLQKENMLSSEYRKLKAMAKINFRGQEYNLSGLGPFMVSPDRVTRQEANEAHWKFFSDKAEAFDEIYDKLVKNRTKTAQKLGFTNFTELAYLRMLRPYSKEKVASFRNAVLKHIVPVSQTLRRRQTKTLGISDLMYYDIPMYFKEGNPTPKGDAQWIIANGQKMYEELSTETGAFFDFMINKGLMDLENKHGKAGGGYCTYIANEGSPFIFSNFNGTAHDIDVLTHEAGHAFQVYESRKYHIPEYYWPTYEACEIHSMSMELLTYPWMHYFFKEETEKYKFSHLASNLLFLPYGVTVDEFQHQVYENPNATPKERNAMWRAIEKKYQPHVNYGDNAYLEGGGFWQKQAHIYESPFYYIDYTLAQICAFQFWQKANNNRAQAFEDYLRLCQAGGSDSFENLVRYANLDSPFDEKCVEKVTKEVFDYLDKSALS